MNTTASAPQPTTDPARARTARTGRILAMIGALGVVLTGIAYLVVGPHISQVMTGAPFAVMLLVGLVIYGVYGRSTDTDATQQRS